ncbi:anti-sigma factor family protein [Phytoactinopolyspora halotolerans]|uniref:Zf-HC2 domain-containing protein n=1 Tax=Phytoactinopolyspora halotolerans TaxID=1981512 RepID=A0A6L9S7B1_9ACTN|nr:zf-HC2 domain-containing protein [Phytoactinopolyspora halotolerans]NEE00544.1 zf-HC2 domain-containing protein [Phytoactinopolyspora halotolerans]
MKHLDDRVSDLVDDRLDHDERDRVLAHLAVCAQCRESVEMERYAKGALTSLGDVDVPASLTDKLMRLAEPGGPLPSERAHAEHTASVASWGPSPGAAAGTALRTSTPTSAEHQHLRGKFVDRHRRGVRMVAGGMVSTGALLVMLASLGAPGNTGLQETPSAVVPPMDEFTLEYARSTGSISFAEPASILAPAMSGWEDNPAGSSGTDPSSGNGASSLLPGTADAGPWPVQTSVRISEDGR